MKRNVLTVAVLLAAALVFGLAACDLFDTDKDEDDSGLIKAAAPVADPPPGDVIAGTTVHFTSATEETRVYLSSSTGALPELDSKGDAVITGDITILAFARAPEGYEDSDEVSFEYKVAGAVINLTNSTCTGSGVSFSGGVFTVSNGADVTVIGLTTTDRVVVQGTRRPLH